MSFADDMKTRSGSYFVFREAANAEELLALLRLRYRVYRDSRLTKFCAENKEGIDLDAYDLRSKHFGLFLHSDGLDACPVGYERVVEDRFKGVEDNLATILRWYPSIATEFRSNNQSIFPLLDYFPCAGSVSAIYRRCRIQGKKLVEPGRFALEQRVRSIAIARQFVTMIFAGLRADGVGYAILTCSPTHERFYSQFGFRRLSGAGAKRIVCKGVSWVCLLGSADGLPDGVKDRVLAMVNVYRRTGQICYNPSNPDCFIELVEKSEQCLSPAKAVA